MATVSRTLSPGGALLRASRMFSLPPAIPHPPGDFSAATSYNSDTATIAYPTMQVVTTPEHLRKRGDWGFKRALPPRSTMRTSTPLIKVRQIDSPENVTDFKSASDHALSLEKFQEMNLPINLPNESTNLASMGLAAKSVFEVEHDFTDLSAIRAAKGTNADTAHTNNHRWKYEGPWLADMTEGAFQKFLKKAVRTRRSEFRQYLRERFAEEMTRILAHEANDEGTHDEPSPVVRADDITEAEFIHYLRELREKTARLHAYVSDFLDLAPIRPPKDRRDVLETFGVFESRLVGPDNPYAIEGPPTTHPSAGISYLRTHSFVENHPFYGPQKKHTPINARIVASRTQDKGQGAKLGVGGFVVETPDGTSAFSERKNVDAGIDAFDPVVVGGSKIWVHTVSARISSSGRVMMQVEKADGKVKEIHREMIGETKVFREQTEEEMNDLEGPSPSRALKRTESDKPIFSSPRGYGVSNNVNVAAA